MPPHGSASLYRALALLPGVKITDSSARMVLDGKDSTAGELLTTAVADKAGGRP